jgi:hypothetical protein
MAGFFPWPFALDRRPDIGVMFDEHKGFQVIAPDETRKTHQKPPPFSAVI